MRAKNQYLHIDDRQAVVRALPEYALTLLQYKTATDSQLMLAGGFIRDVVSRQPTNDIDFFCSEDTELFWAEYIPKVLEDAGVKHTLVKTKKAYTFICDDGNKIQLIYDWPFPFTPEGRELLLSEFDFTVSKCVLWFNGHENDRAAAISDFDYDGICDQRFYVDLANKRLRYACPQTRANPAGSLWRVIKFVGRGYHITAAEFKALALMVDPNDLDESQGEY